MENYSNFNSKFSFNNGSIFEIHGYFRTSGNDTSNDLSQLINTLSNQDFLVEGCKEVELMQWKENKKIVEKKRSWFNKIVENLYLNF